MPTIGSGIPLVISPGEAPTKTSSLTLSLKVGCLGATWHEQQYSSWVNTDWTTWTNWGCPPTASGITSNNLNLYLLGDIGSPYSGSIPLFLGTVSQATHTGTIDLFIKGGTNVESGELPLFLKNTQVAVGGPAGFVVTGERTLYTAGRPKPISLNNNIPMFIPVSATGTITSNIPLFLRNAEAAVTSSIDLFLENFTIHNAAKLFIKGYWSVFGASNNRAPGVPVPAIRAGGNINSAGTTNTPSYLDMLAQCGPLATTCPPLSEDVFDEVLDSRTHVFNDKSRPGARPRVGNIPLFLFHNIGMSNQMNFFTSGIPFSSNEMILMTSGAGAVNNNMAFYIDAASGVLSQVMFLNTIGSIEGV